MDIFGSFWKAILAFGTIFQTSTAPVAMPPDAELFGCWTYTENYCGPSDAHKAVLFTVCIQAEGVSLGGNEITCNTCWDACTFDGDKIVFEEDNGAAACTQMACRPTDLSLCRGQQPAVNVLSDMTYKVEGDQLTLTANGRSTVLKRVVETEEE